MCFEDVYKEVYSWESPLKVHIVRKYSFESQSQLVRYWCFMTVGDQAYDSKASVFGKLWERQKNIYFSHTLIISKLIWRQSQSFANSRPAQGSLALLHFFVSPWPEHCLYLYHWQSEPHKQT